MNSRGGEAVSRSVLAVLGVTFLALAGLACWIPVNQHHPFGLLNRPVATRVWAWELRTAERVRAELDKPPPEGATPDEQVAHYFRSMQAYAQSPAAHQVRAGRWALEFTVILALGGLLALTLHTRDRRRTAAA